MSYSRPSLSPAAGVLLSNVDDLTQWRRAAACGQTLQLPPVVGAALVDLAIAALVSHQLVPNPHLAKAAAAVSDAVAANRATQQWHHGRRLFAGGTRA